MSRSGANFWEQSVKRTRHSAALADLAQVTDHSAAQHASGRWRYLRTRRKQPIRSAQYEVLLEAAKLVLSGEPVEIARKLREMAERTIRPTGRAT
jgi:hypothetical protein